MISCDIANSCVPAMKITDLSVFCKWENLQLVGYQILTSLYRLKQPELLPTHKPFFPLLSSPATVWLHHSKFPVYVPHFLTKSLPLSRSQNNFQRAMGCGKKHLVWVCGCVFECSEKGFPPFALGLCCTFTGLPGMSSWMHTSSTLSQPARPLSCCNNAGMLYRNGGICQVHNLTQFWGKKELVRNTLIYNLKLRTSSTTNNWNS